MSSRYIFGKKRNVIIFRIVDFVGSFLVACISIITLEKFRRPSLNKVKKILVVRFAHIGDVLFITPSLRALRNRFPKSHIAVMVGSWGKEILEGNPNIDEIIVYDAIWYDRNKNRRIDWKSELIFLWRMRRRKIDLLVKLGLDVKDTLFCFLLGAKRRAGSEASGLGFLFTDKVPYGEKKHDLEVNLDVVCALGADTSKPDMEIWLDDRDRRYANELFKRSGIEGNNPVIAIHPGTGDHQRSWREDGFASVGNSLSEKYGARIILLGGHEDVSLSNKIVCLMKVPPINLAGRTTIKQTAAIMSQCDLCLGLESCSVHISAAVETPTIAIFSGFTDTKRWAISNERVIVIKRDLPCGFNCQPRLCSHRICLTGIEANEVLMQVEKLRKVKSFGREERKANKV